MTVPQSATGVVGVVRKPIVVLLLSIVTLGIYSLYWQYASFKEMKTYSGEGIGGGLGLLFAFLVGIVNVFMLPFEVGKLYAREGRAEPVTAMTGFWVFLPIVGGIIWIFKVQGRLNDFWISHGAVTDAPTTGTASVPHRRREVSAGFVDCTRRGTVAGRTAWQLAHELRYPGSARKVPAIRPSGPTRGAVHGALHLYTDRGRRAD